MAATNMNDLLKHENHLLELVWYGNRENPDSVTLECRACGVVVLEFNTDGGSPLRLGPISRDLSEKDAELIRSAAAEQYEEEGILEIDPGAVVSKGEEPGAYVQAWVWVDFKDHENLAHLAQSEEEMFPMSDWQYEVANGDTTLGLAEWRADKKEMMEDE